MPKIRQVQDNFEETVVEVEKLHEDLANVVTVWQIKKYELSKIAAETKALNKTISAVIDELGSVDNKGHRWLELPKTAPGYDSKGKPIAIKRLQRRKNVSVYIDEDAAVELLDKHGALDGVAEHWMKVDNPDLVIQAVNYALTAGFNPFKDGPPEVETRIDKEALEAALEALVYEDKIKKAELDALKTESVTWALWSYE